MPILEFLAWARVSFGALLSAESSMLTFGALAKQIERTVRFLNLHRIGRSNCVAVILPNGPQLAVAFTSIASGAVCAPLNPAYSTSGYRFFLADLHPNTLLSQPPFFPAPTLPATHSRIPLLPYHPSTS